MITILYILKDLLNIHRLIRVFRPSRILLLIRLPFRKGKRHRRRKRRDPLLSLYEVVKPAIPLIIRFTLLRPRSNNYSVLFIIHSAKSTHRSVRPKRYELQYYRRFPQTLPCVFGRILTVRGFGNSPPPNISNFAIESNVKYIKIVKENERKGKREDVYLINSFIYKLFPFPDSGFNFILLDESKFLSFVDFLSVQFGLVCHCWWKIIKFNFWHGSNLKLSLPYLHLFPLYFTRPDYFREYSGRRRTPGH